VRENSAGSVLTLGGHPCTVLDDVEGRPRGVALARLIAGDGAAEALVVLQTANGIDQRSARDVQVAIIAEDRNLLNRVDQGSDRVVSVPGKGRQLAGGITEKLLVRGIKGVFQASGGMSAVP
jgi:hypothetical protein